MVVTDLEFGKTLHRHMFLLKFLQILLLIYPNFRLYALLYPHFRIYASFHKQCLCVREKFHACGANDEHENKPVVDPLVGVDDAEAEEEDEPAKAGGAMCMELS